MNRRELSQRSTCTSRGRHPVSPVVIFQPPDTQDQTRPFSKQPMIMLPLFCWVWRLLYRTAARLTQKEEQEEVCLQPYLRMPGEEKPTLDGPFNHSGLSVQINSSADSPPKTNWAPQQPGPQLLKAIDTGKMISW